MLFFLWADSQLDAAIKYLQELIEDDPRDVPQAPPCPDKSKDERAMWRRCGGSIRGGAERKVIKNKTLGRTNDDRFSIIDMAGLAK